MVRLLCLGLLLASCGGDPCATLNGPPMLVLGGADQTGQVFEPFVPGDSRTLILGPQGGMHVWLQAQISGVCPTTAVLERRVVDDAHGMYVYGRGPVDFVLAEDGESYQLTTAIPMILCPQGFNWPVVDQPMRFVAMVIDDEGRRADAVLSFIPRCPAGIDCVSICTP
jgi:hypothetical protein